MAPQVIVKYYSIHSKLYHDVIVAITSCHQIINSYEINVKTLTQMHIIFMFIMGNTQDKICIIGNVN